MTLRKMMLLAGMALAAIAFAVPASASAASTHWTDDHEVVSSPANITAPFEGFLKFTVAPPFVPVHSTFGCQVTIKVNVTGPTAAQITEFRPTTTECLGTGVFTGCQLEEDVSNVPFSIANTDADLDITKPGGDITVFNKYESCAGGALPNSDLLFPSITATPTLDSEGTIEEIHISGTATTTSAAASGSVKPEGANTLGLVTVN